MNIWLLPSTVAERLLYTENTNTNRYPPPIYISTPPHKNFHRQHRRNALQSSYLFSIKYSPDFLRCFLLMTRCASRFIRRFFSNILAKDTTAFCTPERCGCTCFLFTFLLAIALLFFTILKIDFSTTIWKKDFKDTQQIQQTDRTFSIQYYPSAFTVS